MLNRRRKLRKRKKKETTKLKKKREEEFHSKEGAEKLAKMAEEADKEVEEELAGKVSKPKDEVIDEGDDTLQIGVKERLESRENPISKPKIRGMLQDLKLPKEEINAAFKTKASLVKYAVTKITHELLDKYGY